MAIGKSFRNNKDKELIKISKDHLKVFLEFEKENRKKEIEITIFEKKIVKINDIKCKRLSDLVGNLNIVLFCPDDLEIIKQGPALRRKFLDMFISGLKPRYLYILTQYMKVMENRNALLKNIRTSNNDSNMLEIWNEKLAELGLEIYNYRKEFIEKINNQIYDIHKKITNEEIRIEYITNFKNKEDYLNLLKSYQQIDIYRGCTTKGIHKDDFNIYIDDKNVNLYGSQGQCRSCILSLKFAELEVIYDEIGEYPILLLDDVLSELDEGRKERLLKNINKYQVVITSTEKENFMNSLSESISYFNIKKGKIIY